MRKAVAKVGYRLYMWGCQPQRTLHGKLVLILRFHRAWCMAYGVDFDAAVRASSSPPPFTEDSEGADDGR